MFIYSLLEADVAVEKVKPAPKKKGMKFHRQIDSFKTKCSVF